MKDPALYEENGDEKENHDRGGRGISFKSIILIGIVAVFAFFIVNSQIFARSPVNGGGLGFRRSCCGSSAAEASTEQIRRAGLEYYAANYGDEAVEAVVQDFGCHQEIHIYKDGQLIKRLSHYGGRILE